MRTQSCKAKGRRLQQKVVDAILATFPHLLPDDCVSTSMGAGGEDVRMSPLCRQSVPLSIECKCQEKLNVWACLEQAQKNAPSGVEPCLVFSRNRSATYATISLPFLLRLLKKANGGTRVPSALASLIREAASMLPEEEPVEEPDEEPVEEHGTERTEELGQVQRA